MQLFAQDHSVQLFDGNACGEGTTISSDTMFNTEGYGGFTENRGKTRMSKRGRPRADIISSLILKGSTSSDSIRCRICSRIFPREKSLQAHLRTHTGKSLSLSLCPPPPPPPLSLSLSLSHHSHYGLSYVCVLYASITDRHHMPNTF